jgi:peptide/nickel transport system permease protein
MSRPLRRFLRHRLAMFGLAVMIFLIGAVLIGVLFGGLDPRRIDIRMVRQPPAAGHILGTDLAGRDVWARLVHGAATSLLVGFGAVAIYTFIGTLIGLTAGFLGGGVDQVLMRFTDAVLSVPPLLLIIVFVSAVGPSLISVLAVIGLLGWPGMARLVRGQVLALREAEFVIASRVIGVGASRLVLRHVFPNVIGPLSVAATFGVASAILLEAGISFLGLGVQPPAPSLGTMINEARSPTVLQALPWMWVPAGLMIAATVLAVNFVGDGLRDALDPRAERGR